MGECLELYFLLDSRRANVIYDFFEKYSFLKKELAEEYFVPQFSDDVNQTFYSDKYLLKYLEENEDRAYVIYWENMDERAYIIQCILQYTKDGKMIIGVVVAGKEPSDQLIVSIYKNIKKYFSSTLGCITSEEPPPELATEFEQFCKTRYSL